MANFYWVGGSTGTTGAYASTVMGSTSAFTWARAFDYNNPLNWRILISGTDGLPGALYGYPNRCPAGVSFTSGWQADYAIIGEPYSSPSGPSGGSGSFGSYFVPKSVAPLLFGGCTSSTLAGSTQPSVTWYAGSTNGNLAAVSGAYLQSFIVKENGLARLTDGNSNYRWSYIGGGLGTPGNTAVPAYSPALEEWELYNTTGITYHPSSTWSKAVGDLFEYAQSNFIFGGQARLTELKLKAYKFRSGYSNSVPQIPYTNPGSTNANLDNQGIVRATIVPVFAKIASGSTAVEYAVSAAELYGTPHYLISGKLLDVIRGGGVAQNTDYSPLVPTPAVAGSFARPRPHLTVIGATVGSVRQNLQSLGPIGTWVIDRDSQIGRVEMYPSNKSFLLELDGCGFQRDSVLTSLGLSGATGNPVSNILDENVDVSWLDSVTDSTYLAGWPAGPKKHGVFIGAVGAVSSKGVTANSIIMNSYRGRGAGITLSVNANLVANEVKLFNSQMVADSLYPTFRRVNVNTLTLWGQSSSGVPHSNGGSLLDFAHQPQFDNWNFGYSVGNQVYGGIVSIQEDQGILRGSQGLRLWNEQLISQFRSAAGTRTGAKASPLVPTVSADEFI